MMGVQGAMLIGTIGTSGTITASAQPASAAEATAAEAIMLAPRKEMSVQADIGRSRRQLAQGYQTAGARDGLIAARRGQLVHEGGHAREVVGVVVEGHQPAVDQETLEM